MVLMMIMQVEQFDVHSPQTTVHEALMFSARCRLSREHDNDTVLHFVEEVQDPPITADLESAF